MANDYAGMGGSYTIGKKGELVLQERTEEAPPAVTVTPEPEPEPAPAQPAPAPEAPPSE